VCLLNTNAVDCGVGRKNSPDLSLCRICQRKQQERKMHDTDLWTQMSYVWIEKNIAFNTDVS
jgi:hypothetical protein